MENAPTTDDAQAETVSDMGLLVANLREEHRLKLGCDYAVVRKYGFNRLLCADVFQRTILETADKFGIRFHTVRVWKGNE